MRLAVMQRTSSFLDDQMVFVGLDVHLKSWYVSVWTDVGEHQSFHQDADAHKLAHYLKRRFPEARYRCAYEAGFSGYHTQRTLEQLGVECVVVAPADIASSQKERAFKRDKSDARKLGRELSKGHLEALYVPTPDEEGDRDLVRTRDRIQQSITRVKNRIKGLLYAHGVRIPARFSGRCWSKAFLAYLDEMSEQSSRLVASTRASLRLYLEELSFQRTQLLTANRLVGEAMAQERNRTQDTLLRSIPGIGPKTASTLRTEILDIHRFRSDDRLASYAGLVPTCHSSGERDRDGRLTFRCNRRLRHVLIESAWTAVRRDPDMSRDYHRLTRRMNGAQAIIRIARKQLRRIRAVLLNQRPFESPAALPAR